MSLLALNPRAVTMLRAALPFIEEYSCGWRINVCVDPDPAAGRVRIVATDGCALFAGAVQAQFIGAAPAPVLLRGASLRQALSAFRPAGLRRAEASSGALAIEADEMRRTACLSLVKSVNSDSTPEELRDPKRIIATAQVLTADERYVDYRRAIPAPVSMSEQAQPAAIHPKYLEPICKAAELLDDRATKAAHVRFFAHDAMSVQCTALSSDAIALVMPMRADSAEYADVYATIF